MATKQEMINTKRKSSKLQQQEDHVCNLQPTLSSPFPSTTIPPPPSPPPPLQEEKEDHDNDLQFTLPLPPVIYMDHLGVIPISNPTPVTTLPPWATTRRATIHSLAHLESRQISTIAGRVQCKKCDKIYEIQYDLREKFNEVGGFIVENKATMSDRAPNEWLNPVLPICKFCQERGNYRVKPVIAEKKREINWLFLLLGQMIGCCTVVQLKYFCKHTKNRRSGVKDQLVYRTYLGLCKQLQPNGPFDP
ncbi:uncharacterized protein LOC132301060 [Cornus florida]|uniref:uncharacterized protein LOC132301060 n=1 Tax=Cornus florida TaxID=4283 RepID=UPI0028A18700|nr:uncharacterized protein LOC132301060 [Cornus florida]